MHLEDGSIFLLRPLFFSNIRVKMIVPSFAALLPDTARKSSSDGTPVLCAVFIDHLAKYIVLFPGPWPF
jgi:hypothetical protein